MRGAAIARAEPRDVHDERPAVELPLSRAGISGYRVEVELCSDKCRSSLVELDVYVDLPSSMRGVHVSRLVSSIRRASSEAHASLLEYLRAIAKHSLELNGYSSSVEVLGRTRTIYSDSELLVEARVVASRSGVVRETLSVSFRGITACPCAQSVYSYYEGTPAERTPTHIQRATLKVTVSSSRVEVDPIEVYSACIDSLSGKLVNYLNRLGEYELLREVIGKPMLAEDVARAAAKALYEKLSEKLAEDSELTLEVVSEESLHEFNVHVELSTSAAELRGLLKSS